MYQGSEGEFEDDVRWDCIVFGEVVAAVILRICFGSCGDNRSFGKSTYCLEILVSTDSHVQRTSRKDMFSSETQEKIDEVKNALNQMRRIADVSHPSRAAVRVMELLLGK